MPRRYGFTLIELLVVIAIIAILAAILFPVFSRAREKARQASCQSNEKQICLALDMYAQDFDEVFPIAWFYGPPPDPGQPGGGLDGKWFSVIYPYIKNTQLFVCPSRRDILGGTKGYGYNHRGNFNPNTGGAHNGFGWAWNDLCTYTGAPISQGDVTYPAETIIIGDPNNTTSTTYNGFIIRANFPAELAEHHNGMGNWGFADGHVKAMRLYDPAGVNKSPLFNVVR